MLNDEGVAGRKGDATRTDTRATNVLQGVAGRPGAQPQGLTQSDSAKSPDALRPSGSKLVVGPNIKMKGVEVTDCETVIVEGHIEAKFDSKLVEIAETGVLTGTASMDVAEIRGRFEGELTVRQHLVIHPTGRVNGYIRYGKIRIEEGGEISGEISTLKSAPGERPTGSLELQSLKSVAAISK
jgi:cytoskeletal protein CcmA (bactofilin family)